MNHLIIPPLYTALAVAGLWLIKKDKDFQITLIKSERIFFGIYSLIAVFLIILFGFQNISASVFASVGFAYLNISAVTDKRTKLVYYSPLWILVVLSVLFESLRAGHFSGYTLIIFLFVMLLGVLRMYGMGDAPMCFISGALYYLLNPGQGIMSALIAECAVIFLSGLSLYVQAVKEKNLKNIFGLKESRPLGPHLQLWTYMIFIFSEICKLWGTVS